MIRPTTRAKMEYEEPIIYNGGDIARGTIEIIKKVKILKSNKIPIFAEYLLNLL
jgi:hypothetical protein